MSSLIGAFRSAATATTTTTPKRTAGAAALCSKCCTRGLFFRHGGSGSSGVAIPATKQHNTLAIAEVMASARPFSTILSFATRNRYRRDFACRDVNAPASRGFRAMGGRPNNSEHQEQLKLKRKQAKEAKQAARKAAIDPATIPPPPPRIKPHHIDAIEKYVAEKWLPNFEHGAGTDRLRRDITLRMKTQKGDHPAPNAKLHPEIVKSIVGELARRGTVQLRFMSKDRKKGHRKWVIEPPTVAPSASDVVANKPIGDNE